MSAESETYIDVSLKSGEDLAFVMMLQPLEAKEIPDIDASATKAERLWKHLPVLGWIVGARMWSERTRPIRKKIEDQLKARPKPDNAIWADNAAKLALAHSVCKIAAEEMGWLNDHFIPDDPAGVVFWAHEDGLDVECAVLEIEQCLGIKLEDAEVEAWFYQILGEVIEFLWVRQQTFLDATGTWPPPPITRTN